MPREPTEKEKKETTFTYGNYYIVPKPIDKRRVVNDIPDYSFPFTNDGCKRIWPKKGCK